MSNPCPNCGTNVVTGAVACPVCGVALQPIGVAGQSNAAWPPIAPSTSPASRNPIFIIVGVITALVLVVVIAAVAGVFVYLKSATQTAEGLERFAPPKIGRFQRLKITHREAVSAGATDTLDTTYVNGTDTVLIRLLAFPTPEQTVAYAKSRVKYYQDHATIQARTSVKNNDGSIADKVITKEDPGTDIEAEVIIWNNNSVVLIATGMPVGTATELTSKLPF